jgi:hypothetical protein
MTRHFGKILALLLLQLAPQGLSAECTSCNTYEGCYDEVEYVDFTPWETGDDAGLWCLPGSGCSESLPTRPTSAEIYQDISHFNHNCRYPSEYTPDQWRTIMMHMRAILPMTAWDYRMALAFMQDRQVKAEKKEELTTASSSNNETEPKKDSLGEMVGSVSEVSQVEFAPTTSINYLSKFNSVFTGVLYADYSAPTTSFFGDFNGNNTFNYFFSPIFLVSYSEEILMASAIGAINVGQQTQFILAYAYVAYFYNDYITFIAGRFFVPLGVYYPNWFPPWIEKSASNPLPRGIDEFNSITPGIDIGFEVKGAIPLCLFFDNCWFKHPSFTYDFWIGNGPSEVSNFTPFTALYPNGSIYFGVPSGNAPNNNNEFAWGGRLAFLPGDLDCFGVSYMQGRWSSNKVAFSADGLGKKRMYRAACFDWNMNFCTSIVFRGEYLWTQYEGNLQQYRWVRNTGYWAQLAFGFDLLSCVSQNLYCWKPCLWDSLELVFRTDAVWSQPSGKASLGKINGGFDYSGFDKKRFTVTLGYYFTQSLTIKFEFAHNYGETGHNPLREFITGSTKKTGFAQDVFTFRLACGF